METGQSACDVCGDSLPSGAYFCGECGASVPEFGAPIEPAPIDPAPFEPTPIEPAPFEQTPIEPAPIESVLLAPEPVSTEAVSPEPTIVSEPGTSVHPFTLVFSNGERAQVVGRGLIGRMPVAPANETWDHLIVVNDPSKTVSKTHLRVEALAEGLMVTDLDSANGTVVSMPGIAAERLAPHERVILMSGATVGIGDQSFIIQ
jgi:hypothetical protein